MSTKLVIEAGRSARNYWADLWRYRELLGFLAWRDLAVRYKQTAIGIAWALIRPALILAVFVAFRRIAGLESRGIPDPLWVLAAVLPWQFFSTALSESASSLVANTNLVSKVYFPRMIIPLATIATACVDFAVTLALLALLMGWYGFLPGVHLAALPLFFALALALCVGLGLLLAALNVEYRDFRYVVPFIVQFGLFVSPIAFSTADVPERWRALYALNPMAGVIEGFRCALLGAPLDGAVLATSVAVTAVLLGTGIWYFRRTEREFADVI